MFALFTPIIRSQAGCVVKRDVVFIYRGGYSWLMSDNTSEKIGNEGASFPPTRPTVFDSKPVQSVQTQNRMGSAKTLRKALIAAADEVGGDEGLKGYLKFLATGSAKLLPRAIAVAHADASHAVNVVLPWLESSRGVDATSAAGGVVIDQPETIEENDTV